MQIIINGFISGLTISTLALAFAVVYVPTRVFHVAIGGIYAAIPFIALACLGLGLHLSLAIVVAVAAGVLLSILCEGLNHYPLEQRGAPVAVHLISSLGIYIVIVQVIALVWGDDVRALRTRIDGIVEAGNIVLTHAQVITVIVSLVLLISFYLWLQYTRLGLHFRALANNPREFVLRGYNVRRFRLLAFGMSGVLCAGTALVVSYDIGFDPHVGFAVLLQAVVAVIIGGRDSFFGPILGGALLGLIRSNVVWFLSARWETAITFLVLVVLLHVRPRGLLGKQAGIEAAQ